MPDEEKWYFAKGGTAYGPVTLHGLNEQFKKGAFTASDFVYCKAQTDGWVKASTIEGLCDKLELEAEPEPEHHEVPSFEKVAFEQAGGSGKHGKGLWSRLRGKK